MDWPRIQRAMAAFALDPLAAGGLWLHGRASPSRDLVLAALTRSLPLPTRRLHPSTTDEALYGGLDLALTLQAGRGIRRPGMLDLPGVLVLPMAERAEPGLAARLALALDKGRHALIVLDESAEPDEALAPALADRMGLFIDLSDARATEAPDLALPDLAAARALRPAVVLPEAAVPHLVAAAGALGCAGPRGILATLAVARSLAALAGRDRAGPEDIEEAASVTLAHRARRMADPEPDEAAPRDPLPQPEAADNAGAGTETRDPALAELVVAAARASLPAGLLDRLEEARAARCARGPCGSGQTRTGNRRGRPLAARAGRPDSPAALDLLATMRAAAPWQTLRRAESPGRALALLLRPADLRVRRQLERSDRLLIFAVDASGSSAVARLAEAKGAVEIFLAEAYARRDHVALLSFRQDAAELMLPPTRSLARTRARLTGLPGGGATPLAAGLDLALAVALKARRRGMAPTLALLTDGRCNIARDGSPGRKAAEDDALAAARACRAAGLAGLVVDVGSRPQPALSALARAMGADYLALPRAGAGALAHSLSAALPG